MRKRINIWGAGLLSLLLLGACYDDNGNYNYSDIGTVSLEITADTTVMYGEDLKLEPKKITYQDTSEDQYEWSWELAAKTTSNVPEYKEIAHTKVLDIVNFQEEIGQYDLRLSAIHKATGVRTMAYCKFTVDNGLSKVYLLLTKQDNGEYDIDAVTYPGGKKRMNQYSLMNGETIRNAERMFYVNSSFSRDERLYLAQTENGQTLSPIDLTYQGTANDWFFEAPARIHITHILTDDEARDQFMICDKGIYYMNNVNSPLKANVRCSLQDGTDYSITGVGTMHNSSGRGRYAFYDELNGRFIEWNFSYGTYYIQPLATATDIAATTFDTQNIGKKKFYTDISGKEDRLWILFEDENSDLWLYTFKDGAGVYYNVIIQPSEAPLKLDAEMQEQFKKATAFCAVKTADKFYYAVDNTIWIYNAATHKTETEPFYTSPDTNMRFTKIFYRDKDEQEITFAGNSNGKGFFYRAKVDYLGRMATPTEEEKEPFKSYDGFGEIKDFIYKYKNY